MNTKTVFLCGALSLAFAAAALAQNIGLNGEEFKNVQKRVGDQSPTDLESNINNYIEQDEQINIDPETGVVKVLRTNQKALINDFITATVPVQFVNPREIRNVLRSAVGIEGGRVEIILDKKGDKDPSNDERFVQLIAPTFMMPSLIDAVKALDVPWLVNVRDGSIKETYYTKFRPAETIDAFASQYAGEGTTAVDPFANAVERRDEPYRVEEYMKAAELHDQKPPQGLFKFNIYEVNVGDDLTIGVDWVAWKNGPGRSLFDVILAGQDSQTHFENATGNFDPNLGAFTQTDPGEHGIHIDVDQSLLSANYLLTSAYLDFLEVKGRARAVASPEIWVFTHKQGIWKATDQFLAFEVSPSAPDAFGIKPTRIDKPSAAGDTPVPHDATGTTDFAVHNRFLRYDVGAKNQLGMMLRVFPSIGQQSSEVEVEFTSTELAGTTPQGTPIISSRRLVTKQRMWDGKCQVLGSLSRDQDVQGSTSAPGLGDIPVLGYLFGREASSVGRKEIVITVTPHIYAGANAGAPDDVVGDKAIETRSMAKGETPIALPSDSFAFDAWVFEEAAPSNPLISTPENGPESPAETLPAQDAGSTPPKY